MPLLWERKRRRPKWGLYIFVVTDWFGLKEDEMMVRGQCELATKGSAYRFIRIELPMSHSDMI